MGPPFSSVVLSEARAEMHERDKEYNKKRGFRQPETLFL